MRTERRRLVMRAVGAGLVGALAPLRACRRVTLVV